MELDLGQFYDSLSHYQRLAIFMRKSNNYKISEYMITHNFYIDDSYFLIPFIVNDLYISKEHLNILISRYMDAMNTLLYTCPEYVSDNLLSLLRTCIKSENDVVLQQLKLYDLKEIIQCDQTIQLIKELGFKIV